MVDEKVDQKAVKRVVTWAVLSVVSMVWTKVDGLVVVKVDMTAASMAAMSVDPKV